MLSSSFLSAEDGVETVEYAIITGLVVAGTIGALAAVGVWVANIYGLFTSTL